MADFGTNDYQPRRRWIHGLSILDLAIAMGVVLVLSCIAIPGFFSRPAITLDHAALLFASDLRYAQNEAAISGQGTRVELSADGDGYAVDYQTGEAVGNPVGGENLRRKYSHDAIFRGVEIQVLEGSSTPSFDRNGFALEGGSYTLTYEGDIRMVHLERGSGHLEIVGLTENWTDDDM